MTARLPSDTLLDDIKQLHPLLIDLSLERINALLEKLGNPERRLPPVIHIAGTNGKGSTAAFLTAICRAAGLRVHRYTSPHLIRFHERIMVAGEPISEAALVDALEHVRSANAGAPMTFYEITTAAAFLAFAETPADVAILEVGLGGRLDATNVIAAPAVTVITPVAMDHADKLGGTIAEIAGEKAGIVKARVPCIVGPQTDDARRVIQQRATSLDAPLTLWGADFDCHVERGRAVFQEDGSLIDLPLPGLRGRHQVVNAGVAVAAAKAFAAATSIPIPEDAIAGGLQSVDWAARMSPVAEGPLRAALAADDELWIDGGHNPAAGHAIADTLCGLQEQASRPTILIAGMMSQKDWRGYFEPFVGLVAQVITVPVKGAFDEANPPEELAASLADAFSLKTAAAPDIPTALAMAGKTSAEPKRIVICGSLYLAGAALAINEGVATRID